MHAIFFRQNTFVLVYHQACQAVDSLAQQYVSLQVDFIHNSLLHDAESFNWSHTQEFFEVSFTFAFRENFKSFLCITCCSCQSDDGIESYLLSAVPPA